MVVADRTVVSIHYTLTNDAGDVLDSSRSGEPLAYLHGVGNIIKGLEQELLGKAAGDSLNVRIDPEDAYGVRHDELVQEVPRDAFQGVDEIQPGMQFRAEGPDGAQIVTVTQVSADAVMIDANHPLAGEALTFDVEIMDVRDATDEELSHGHVHGPGDAHH
ncbi:MAG: peptidylprolyl isomerase [Pseudomonadota bacterium]|nr:peptidylprolyl isomerase [Pseudomonadota bacterium]